MIDSNRIRQIAADLLPHAVICADPAGGGANSRIYRVEDTAGRLYALKIYPSEGEQGRDRLGQEVAALRFLAAGGVTSVPVVIAAAPHYNAALYGWVDGTPAGPPDTSDIDALAQFLIDLQPLRDSPGAGALPPASASCFSLAAVIRQGEERARAFLDGTPPLIRAYVGSEWQPAFEALARQAEADYRQYGLDPEAKLAAEQRALSPSDFGMHNALRRPDGSLAFVDFEYFGWDDPVKAVTDALVHPGSGMTREQQARFRAAVLPVFEARDRDFMFRLRTLFPLFNLIWCLICLNRHLPARRPPASDVAPDDEIAADLAGARERQRLAR